MPVSFSTADQEVYDLLTEVMRERHRPLFDAAVRVGVLMASNDTGDAVTGGGYPAYAKIKVVPLKDRLTKQFDAELLIDLKEWDDFGEGVKIALLDHELSHLELKKYAYAPVLDGKGQPTGETEIVAVEKDDLNRPKLRLKKGDFNAGDAFAGVIQRNGRAAVEFLNAKKFDRFAEESLRGER